MTRVALVPGVLALLPEYAGIEDPVPELRAACLAAVAWLGGDVEVLADPQGERVGRALLEAAGVSRLVAGAPRTSTTGGSAAGVSRLVAGARRTSTTGGSAASQPAGAYLVVGNGSARRSEKAPGYLDPRAAAYDEGLRAWLGGSGSLDVELGAELLASTDGIALMAERLGSWGEPVVDYDDDPFGVQYWVLRWEVP